MWIGWGKALQECAVRAGNKMVINFNEVADVHSFKLFTVYHSWMFAARALKWCVYQIGLGLINLFIFGPEGFQSPEGMQANTNKHGGLQRHSQRHSQTLNPR